MTTTIDNKKYLFENMPIARALTKMAIPTIIGQLITMVYNLADTFFIGQTDNPFSVAFVLFFIQNALSNLFGVGGGSLISRLLGQNRKDEAKRVNACSLYGTTLLALLYSCGCYIFMEPLLGLPGRYRSYNFVLLPVYILGNWLLAEYLLALRWLCPIFFVVRDMQNKQVLGWGLGGY